jgi:hypothetical protein
MNPVPARPADALPARPRRRGLRIKQLTAFEEETYQVLALQHPGLDRHRLHQVLCSHHRYGFPAEVKRRVAGAAQEMQIALARLKRACPVERSLDIAEINRLLLEVVGLVTRDRGLVIVPPAIPNRSLPPAT